MPNPGNKESDKQGNNGMIRNKESEEQGNTGMEVFVEKQEIDGKCCGQKLDVVVG